MHTHEENSLLLRIYYQTHNFFVGSAFWVIHFSYIYSIFILLNINSEELLEKQFLFLSKLLKKFQEHSKKATLSQLILSVRKNGKFSLLGSIRHVLEYIGKYFYWQFDIKWRLVVQSLESPLLKRPLRVTLIPETRATWKIIQKNNILIYISLVRF